MRVLEAGMKYDTTNLSYFCSCFFQNTIFHNKKQHSSCVACTSIDAPDQIIYHLWLRHNPKNVISGHKKSVVAARSCIWPRKRIFQKNYLHFASVIWSNDLLINVLVVIYWKNFENMQTSNYYIFSYSSRLFIFYWNFFM